MGIFDFLKRLFSSQNKSEPSPLPARPKATSIRPIPFRTDRDYDNAPLQELRTKIMGKGRPEYPFLSKEYSPSSRVPCVDFTSFIIERLRAHDVPSVNLLMMRIIEANPGLGIGSSWICEQIEDVLKAPLEKHLHFHDCNAYLQLRAMWIIAAKGGGKREFWLFNDSPRYFAQALCPYEIELKPAIENMRKKGNRAIRGWRKDGEDYPLFKASELKIPPVPNGACVEKFRQLSIGARLHLFYAAAAGGGRLAHISGFIPRDVGLYPLDSSREIIDSGLLCLSQNAELLKSSLQKTDLLDACHKGGVTHKKSWNKEQLL